MARGDVDLEGMTSKQLKDLRDRVVEAMADREREERQALKAKIAALAADAGFSLDEIVGGKRGGRGGGKGVAIKYRNPDNPDETWSGRGRKPNWLNEKMSKRGAKIEDFAV